MKIFTRFTKKTDYKQRVKGEYKYYSRITGDLGAVSLKDGTALFSSTKKYLIFCDFAFSIAKEQNTTFIRAPPLVLKSNPFQDERRTFNCRSFLLKIKTEITSLPMVREDLLD